MNDAAGLLAAFAQGVTAAGFWRRARAFFEGHGVRVRRVLTDNGPCYKSTDWVKEVVAGGADVRYTRPYRPQTNGKVERFHRTLADEWACARLYASDAERCAEFRTLLHTYNCHRGHIALGGQPPATRVPNLSGQYT